MGNGQNGGPLRVEGDDRGVLHVTLDKPARRNALDQELIDQLRKTFEQIDDDVRVVVLTGEGRIFCAGADIDWLRGKLDSSFEENLEESRTFEAMMRALHDCPAPLVARVNGHCFGGGAGIISCADVVVAVRSALFGFTEVRLGIAPATISPYVLPKIGMTAARHLFLTGERFDAEHAAEIGLVHILAEAETLDEEVHEVVDSLLAGGPRAQREMKALLRTIAYARDLDEAAEHTVETISRLRVSDEGQEGMSAFFEDREPDWRA